VYVLFWKINNNGEITMCDFDEEIEDCEEEEELEFRMGEDGVIHLKEKLPTLTLEFQTEEEMIYFMAKCSVLGLSSELIIPEGTRWGVEYVSDKNTFLDGVNKKIDELKI
jgi:hypothetical protein